MKALLGKKVGMTQVFDEETGKATPVTVVDVSGNVVAKHIKGEDDKVTHVEIGLGQKKEKNTNKAVRGQYKNIDYVPMKSATLKIKKGGEVLEEGTELKVETFEDGETVDVTGVSKGKGFQGVMKRHGFKGGQRTHGQSDRDRAPGSVGAGTTPGRVYKGKKMAGRMGREKTTVKNMKVVKADTANNLLLLKGSVPGKNSSYVLINGIKN